MPLIIHGQDEVFHQRNLWKSSVFIKPHNDRTHSNEAIKTFTILFQHIYAYTFTYVEKRKQLPNNGFETTICFICKHSVKAAQYLIEERKPNNTHSIFIQSSQEEIQSDE